MSDRPEAPDPDADSEVAAFLRGVARAPAIPPDSLVGKRLAHFELRAKLGAGGMGVVYEAYDAKLGRSVAIKVLSDAADPEAQRRFLREARAASRVEHPNVATIYEVGEDRHRAYIAMELVRGETLGAWLASRRSITVRIRVAIDIVGALAAAHASGIIHRDLKPENVMVAASTAVKVLDFGIAKDTSEPVEALGETVTAEGRIIGTPAYMSPEQAKGMAVDARSDVFSLGVLLYEVFTGARPFSGRSAAELLIAIDRDAPVAPSTRAREVPPALERIILRCLEKNPADRYADGAEVARALDAAEERPGRAPWWGWLVVAILSIDLVAGVAVYMHGRAGAGGARLDAGASVATVVTGEPPPLSTSDAALDAYRHGLGVFRGAGEGACRDFARAAAADAHFGAAHLRAAICVVDAGDLGRPREPFHKAVALRDTLSARDRALLDAFEPILERNPSDALAAGESLRAAAARFPDDAEIAYQRAVVVDMTSPRDAAPLYRHVLELDPSFARAWLGLGAMAYFEGRVEEGDRAFERCLGVAPEASTCLLFRAEMQAVRGECAELEATARRMIILGPDAFQGRQLLASSLVSQGRPVAAIRELLAQGELLADGGSLDPRSTIPWSILQAQVDILDGDFGSALTRLQAFEAGVRGLPDEESHAWLAASESLVFTELRRDSDARRVAADFLARYQGWEPTPGADVFAIAGDQRVLIASVLRRAGTLPLRDFDRLRDDEVMRWSKRARRQEDAGLVWLVAYAVPARTSDEAKEAVAALARLGPPPPFVLDLPIDAYVGHVYALAGQAAAALPRLERATRACDWVSQTYDHLRALDDLGRVREALGDPAGACEAYGALLARWGSAAPRSLTGEDARARAKALHCKR